MDFFGPGTGHSVVSDPIGILLVDLLVDLSVLTVGFILIQKARCLKSVRFVPYLILVVIGGLLIDEAALFVKRLLHITNQTDWIMFDSAVSFGEELPYGLWGVSVFTFLLLAAFNYFLCSAFYKFSRKETATIAILMGFLTHPDFYSAYSWMPIVWFLLFLLFYSYTRKPHQLKKGSMTSQQASPAVSATKVACQDKHPKPEKDFPE